MFSVKLIVFLTLLVCGTSHANQAPGLGYLFVNGSQPAYCYDLSPNKARGPTQLKSRTLDSEINRNQTRNQEITREISEF
jgi:hypothetical protein